MRTNIIKYDDADGVVSQANNSMGPVKYKFDETYCQTKPPLLLLLFFAFIVVVAVVVCVFV